MYALPLAAPASATSVSSSSLLLWLTVPLLAPRAFVVGRAGAAAAAAS